jgi:hypothetical protein
MGVAVVNTLHSGGTHFPCGLLRVSTTGKSHERLAWWDFRLSVCLDRLLTPPLPSAATRSRTLGHRMAWRALRR